MKKSWLIVSTGFSLFAMFFGSGNLVFPISVGKSSDGHCFFASLGILITGVIVPFLGVLGMMLFQGDIKEFFKCFGKVGTFLFSFISLALMGPFGVFARCLTVAHGALQLLLPDASLILSSLTMCSVIYLLTINKNKIVTILGSLLTPFLLVAIGMIAFFGLKNGIDHEITYRAGWWPALKNGYFQGYQTMDLLAAFFFSTFIIKHLKNVFIKSSAVKLTDDQANLMFSEKKGLKVFFNAAMIGAGILSSVYVLLVLLGWAYQPQLQGKQPQEMLGIIAIRVLGSMAAPCVCVAIVLACLTTAIVLASLFADFLRKEVFREKIGNKQALIATLMIGFLISTLEFSGISKFLGPILELIYPALITLTIVNIGHKLWGFRMTHWPITLTLLAKICILR